MPDVPGWQYGPASYPVTIGSWTPGEPLEVSAVGQSGQVSAFSATIETPPPLGDVRPAFNAGPVDVVTSQGLSVSWISDGHPTDQVYLGLGQTTSESLRYCSCSVPDSAGTLSLDAVFLSQFVTTGQVSGNIQLSRTTTSTAVSGNVSLELVGEVALGTDAVFK